MKNSIIILVLSASTFLLSCSSGRGDFDASGVFEATEVIVSAEASGRLERFDLEEGQAVCKGAILGYVDTVQLYLQKMQLLSSVKAVGSRRQDVSKQVAATREQISTQLREKRRIESLLEAKAATTKQLDDINSALAVLEKQLAAQLSTLENSNRSVGEEGSGLEMQVAQLDNRLEKSYVSSPIDGAVLVKYAQAGEVVSPGRPLFKVADTQKMLLRAYITSGQLTQLRIGEQVSVFTDRGDKGRAEYGGEVVWISDKSEFTPKTIQTRDERANLVYAVKIAVQNSDSLIKIGMYADVKFGVTK